MEIDGPRIKNEIFMKHSRAIPANAAIHLASSSENSAVLRDFPILLRLSW